MAYLAEKYNKCMKNDHVADVPIILDLFCLIVLMKLRKKKFQSSETIIELRLTILFQSVSVVYIFSIEFIEIL